MKSTLQIISKAGQYIWLAVMAMVLLWSNSADAVPSFARQTGMACAACHTVFPELTPFGRQFKLNGYVISNLKTIKDITLNKEDILELNAMPPISFMFQTSVTSTNKALPDANIPGHLAQDGTFEFPQQASIFFAGAISPKIGAFVQATYSSASGTFGFDNTDLRFADNLSNENRDFVYGITLNNNPTVQDVWNSTPAWGFPFEGPDAAPTPAAATRIDGSLAQNVGGASAYLWWNNALYAEAGVYRTSPQGFQNGTTGGNGPIDSSAVDPMNGVAPYWRLAYQAQWDRHSLEVGTFGLYEEVFPTHLNPAPLVQVGANGPTDNFTDVAADAQYQFIGDEHIFTVLTSYIHEDQDLHGSVNSAIINGLTPPNSHDTLETFKITGNYYYHRKYGLSLGYVNTWGTTDTALYAPAPVTGSNNGSPDSDYFIAQATYVPWLNTKFVLQYTAYNKFNGASSNYDGSGRSASDNNTLYFLGWFNF